MTINLSVALLGISILRRSGHQVAHPSLEQSVPLPSPTCRLVECAISGSVSNNFGRLWSYGGIWKLWKYGFKYETSWCFMMAIPIQCYSAEIMKYGTFTQPASHPAVSIMKASCGSACRPNANSSLAWRKMANKWYPLVNWQFAIENGHRNSGFTHWKWWFSIAMLNYQRVTIDKI